MYFLLFLYVAGIVEIFFIIETETKSTKYMNLSGWSLRTKLKIVNIKYIFYGFLWNFIVVTWRLTKFWLQPSDGSSG